MIQYVRYFSEWDGPPAGIDTISIWIHPDLINRHTDFHEYGNINESINCRYKKEKHNGQTIRTNYLVEIQTEAINPEFDILTQVLYILTGFVYNGTLQAPENVNMPDLPEFFFANFHSFFSIDTLDFYFDFKDGDCIFRGNEDPRFPGTIYSRDYPSPV